MPNKGKNLLMEQQKNILFTYSTTRIPVQGLFIPAFNRNLGGGKDSDVKWKPAKSIKTSLLALQSDKRFIKLLTRNYILNSSVILH